MEQPMRCKTLTAIYRNEVKSPRTSCELDFSTHESISIHIMQSTERTIIINSTSEQSVNDLIAVLTKIERLLMLFDGCFIYEKWESILEDLDVAHQVYLYSLCDTNQPVDLRCAFLIELAEPVVEIVKANCPLFESLNPGKQGTSLRDCLRALITTYGSDIFENEINSYFETFLKSLVNSRVRIMHIKRNCHGSYLNRPESILYSIKISFLYRIVLLNLLGISPSLYHENLISNIQRWNSWNDIMDNFLYRLQK